MDSDEGGAHDVLALQMKRLLRGILHFCQFLKNETRCRLTCPLARAFCSSLKSPENAANKSISNKCFDSI